MLQQGIYFKILKKWSEKYNIVTVLVVLGEGEGNKVLDYRMFLRNYRNMDANQIEEEVVKEFADKIKNKCDILSRELQKMIDNNNLTETIVVRASISAIGKYSDDYDKLEVANNACNTLLNLGVVLKEEEKQVLCDISDRFKYIDSVMDSAVNRCNNILNAIYEHSKSIESNSDNELQDRGDSVKNEDLFSTLENFFSDVVLDEDRSVVLKSISLDVPSIFSFRGKCLDFEVFEYKNWLKFIDIDTRDIFYIIKNREGELRYKNKPNGKLMNLIACFSGASQSVIDYGSITYLVNRKQAIIDYIMLFSNRYTFTESEDLVFEVCDHHLECVSYVGSYGDTKIYQGDKKWFKLITSDNIVSYFKVDKAGQLIISNPHKDVIEILTSIFH